MGLITNCVHGNKNINFKIVADAEKTIPYISSTPSPVGGNNKAVVPVFYFLGLQIIIYYLAFNILFSLTLKHSNGLEKRKHGNGWFGVSINSATQIEFLGENGYNLLGVS